ncbi:hypothetical protein ACOMHN_040424 [Nucella lapillus]
MHVHEERGKDVVWTGVQCGGMWCGLVLSVDVWRDVVWAGVDMWRDVVWTGVQCGGMWCGLVISVEDVVWTGAQCGGCGVDWCSVWVCGGQARRGQPLLSSGWPACCSWTLGLGGNERLH